MPVPADITHMTEALRRRIDWQEREALAGTVRPGRQRGIQDVTSRKSRWVGTINLQRPAAGERPTAANGATSFHTRLSTISRSDSATAAGRSAVNAAVGQERYLTDNWARELSKAAGSERYVVDGDQADDSVNDPDSRVVFIHSNISDVGVERIAFWEEAWRVERKAGAPRLRLNLTTMSESDWETLSAEGQATPTTSARAQATAPNIKPVGRAHLAVKEALFPEPWLSNQLAAHRESPQYRALPSLQRDLLDEAAAMPLHYLGAGLGAIVRSDGCINIGFSSAAVWESFCALRDIPGGWQMLNAVARPSSENDKFKLDLQWNRIIIADQVEAEMPSSGIGRPRDRGR